MCGVYFVPCLQKWFKQMRGSMEVVVFDDHPLQMSMEPF